MSSSVAGIQLPVNEPCAFCDYLSGRRPFTILARDDLTATLVTRAQRGVSHLLVITTRHVPTILGLTDSESDAVGRSLKQAAIAIDNADHRPGISIWQNNGVDAHQDIPHFHVHVAGTLPGGGTDFGEVRELSIEETDEIAKHLRGS